MTGNFAGHLTAMAKRQPDMTALICPRPYGNPDRAPRYTYEQLNEESELIARGMMEVGIGPGVRAIFLVQPGFKFFALAFGLLKAGGILVGVDPGIGRERMAGCMRDAEAEAFIGVPLAHFGRRLAGWGKGSVKTAISTARRTSRRSGVMSYTTLRALGQTSNQSLPDVTTDDPAIVAFTSGSTGPPKGVVYNHGLLNAQVGALRDCFGCEEGERDLVTFPHFAFFGPALSATLVLANIDFSRPGLAIPSWLVRSIRAFEITNMFGSPALLNRLGRHGAKRGIKLPSLKRVVSAGAPVPGHVVRNVSDMLEGATFFTPYGATEALPVTCITGDEILSETLAMSEEGHGVCVGEPVGDMDVRIIRITDEPLEEWSDELQVPQGEVGEIAAAGPVVSRTYFGRPEQTARAKIQAGDRFFHRMGDLGYFDAQGRLWLCGRKSQRIQTASGMHFTVPLEAVFNSHRNVFRTALVGVRDAAGYARPVLCVELARGTPARDWNRIRDELLELATQRPETAVVRDILRHRRFPVDRRHNAKIVREELALWAERQLR